MRLRISLALALLSSFAFGAPVQAAETLTVYTYDGFTAEWGPGPQVEKAFETQCGCDLQFVTVGDAVSLLNRLRIEADRVRADIVLGLDNNLVAEARATGQFVRHNMDLSALEVPGDFTDDMFVPFDYGHFAFVFDRETVKMPPASLKELVEGGGDYKIAIQDPRTSTPGLGLLLWMKSVYGDAAPQAWAKLKDRILTVSPDWSGAYGLLTKGEADMAFSYVTSPAYHRIAESSDRYAAADFAEGHYLQIEVAGMTAKGAQNPLAAQFLAFVISPAFQDVIPQTNWMFPAGKTSAPLDPVFNELVKPQKTLLFDAQTVSANRKAWIDEWLSALGR